jgi:uncharacterized protein (UPF0332 family)
MEYFKIAEEMEQIQFTKCNDQIKIRSIINRIYYGIFHYVQQRFSVGYDEHGSCHTQILKKGELFGYSSDFGDLMDLRKKADYELDKTMTQADLEFANSFKDNILGLTGTVPYDFERTDLEEFRKAREK